MRLKPFLCTCLFCWTARRWLEYILLGSERRISFGYKVPVFVDVETCAAFWTRLISLKMQGPTHLSETTSGTYTFQHGSIIDSLSKRVNRAYPAADLPSATGLRLLPFPGLFRSLIFWALVPAPFGAWGFRRAGRTRTAKASRRLIFKRYVALIGRNTDQNRPRPVD